MVEGLGKMSNLNMNSKWAKKIASGDPETLRKFRKDILENYIFGDDNLSWGDFLKNRYEEAIIIEQLDKQFNKRRKWPE